MKKSDRELGMHRGITRRDFIHDTTLAAVGIGLSPLAGAVQNSSSPYPPTLTGLRGSHPGAYETAHAIAREGKTFTQARDLDEQYDLIVVGGGISGLAAAHYYRQRFGDKSRILILENHDDFGGHARRNEFHQGGAMRLALGGTHNLEWWNFSDTVNELLADLGIDVQDMRGQMEFRYGRNAKNGPATWFDAETYGENKLLTDLDFKHTSPSDMAKRVDEFPVSDDAKTQLRTFYELRNSALSELDEAELVEYLESTPYNEFLETHGGLGPEARALYANACHGSWGIETSLMSAGEAMDDGLPGMHLLNRADKGERGGYPVAMFPDGNASVARLLVQRLMPEVAPGTNADNVAMQQFDYAALDRPDSSVRLRLNSTVVNAENSEGGVRISYVKDGETLRLRGRHSVLACYHSILPHLCPQLPQEQREALAYQVKIPLLLTNVLLRSAAPMDKLGVGSVRCPGRMHAHLFLQRGINTGGYSHPLADSGPVPLSFWGALSPPPGVEGFEPQMRASRLKMLSLEFEDYEREVRTVLDGLLGPAGFDVQRDILAITVNRWPHGYAREYLDLWDWDWEPGLPPHEIARRPFGNLAIANADAGAEAYTQTAIEQALRAVNDLPKH